MEANTTGSHSLDTSTERNQYLTEEVQKVECQNTKKYYSTPLPKIYSPGYEDSYSELPAEKHSKDICQGRR